MPKASKKLCNKPGCWTTTSSRYCAEHAHLGVRRAWEKTTTSAASRGYGSKWRERRKRVLARDPICKVCNQRVSTAVDHIKPKAQGGQDDDDNLQGICRACHTTKTRQEAAVGQRGAAGAKLKRTRKG